MKRPKLKKASKRVSCSKRYKIQRKVREHNKKLRKEAKKKGTTKRVKKDPGVPSIAPFKEDVLREAEERRLKLEELKEKKKLERQKEQAQKRKEATGNDDAPKAKRAKKEEAAKDNGKSPKAKEDKYTRKFLCIELNKVIDASDVIIEVLDARDPQGCRCPQLEEAVLKHGGNKKLLFVLNKIDLVPKENVEKWLLYLQQEFPTVIFKASTQLQDKTVQEKKKRMVNGAIDQTKGVACFGGDCLLQLLQDYAEASGSESSLKVGIVGFPNVGKSSLINSLKGVRVCNSGVQRGMTKCLQEVHIAKNVKMIDSPSILASPANPAVAMALRSLPSTEKPECALDAVRALLKHCNNQQVMLQYNVPDFKNSLDFLTSFAKKRGFMQKGAVPNTELAAGTFLSDWTGAKLSYHSKPPENIDLDLSDTVARQKEWAVEKLSRGNAETIKNVKCPSAASSIAFSSRGPTAGLLSESEVLEAKGTERVSVGEEGGLKKAPEIEEPKLEPEKERAQEKEEEGSSPSEIKSTARPAKVTFQSTPVSIDPSSAQKEDDAYDFNIDFK